MVINTVQNVRGLSDRTQHFVGACLAGLSGSVDRLMSGQNLQCLATETGKFRWVSEPEQVSVTGTIGCSEAGKQRPCLSHTGNYVCPRMLWVFRVMPKPDVGDGRCGIKVVNVPMT